MTDVPDEKEKITQRPAAKQQYFLVSAQLLRITIDLIDEEVTGKKGRPIANALEQSTPVPEDFPK